MFGLPRSSKIGTGKIWPAPEGARRAKAFKIYRFDPDRHEGPRIDTYHVDLDECGPMVLDALFFIKNRIDSTLVFRRSCGEGDLRQLLDEYRRHQHYRCTKPISDIKGRVRIYPLPHLPVIKDLVPDMTDFFAQYASIEPWLKTKSPTPEKEWRQSPEERASARRPVRVYSLCLLHHGMPELLVERHPVSWAGHSSCTRIAGSWTAATRQPANGLTKSKIRFGSIAVTRFSTVRRPARRT